MTEGATHGWCSAAFGSTSREQLPTEPPCPLVGKADSRTHRESAMHAEVGHVHATHVSPGIGGGRKQGCTVFRWQQIDEAWWMDANAGDVMA